jgi:hypothetical protein
VPFLLAVGRANLISNTRTTLKIVTRQSRPWVTPFSTVPGTGAPSYAWLLCLTYVCFILNFTVSSALHGGVPIQRTTGSTNNTSPLLRFRFWEPVYYKLDDSTFPSESREKLARFVGIAENVGHFMTFKILNEDTMKIIFRSKARSALDPKAKNLRLDPLSGETSIPVTIKSCHESDSSDNKEYPCPFFTPATLSARHS